MRGSVGDSYGGQLAVHGDGAAGLPRSPAGRLPWYLLPVAVFVVAATSVSGVYPLNYLVKAFGVIMVVAYLLNSIIARAYPSAEVVLYVAWLAWSLVGVAVAASGAVFWSTWITCFQIWALLVVIAGFTSSRTMLSANLLAFLVGVAIVGVASMVDPTYQFSDNPERVTGLGRDENEFGRMMVLATIVLAYFWMVRRSGWLRYFVLLPAMAVCAWMVLRSGSRFGILSLLLFYGLWLWFYWRREASRRRYLVLPVLAGVVLGGALIFWYGAETEAVKRLGGTWAWLHGAATVGQGTAGRLEIYRMAWRVIAENPVLGVGLGNFRLAAMTTMVTHSDYTGVAAETGLVGFVLYMPIYIVLLRRGWLIARASDDPQVKYTALLIQAVCIVFLFVGIGNPNQANKVSWIFLGPFIGYSNVVWYSLRERVAKARALGAVAMRGY